MVSLQAAHTISHKKHITTPTQSERLFIYTGGGGGASAFPKPLSLGAKESESADLINPNPSSPHKALVPGPKFKQLLRQCNGTRMSEELRVLIIKVLMKI